MTSIQRIRVRTARAAFSEALNSGDVVHVGHQYELRGFIIGLTPLKSSWDEKEQRARLKAAKLAIVKAINLELDNIR
jgi:phosphate-selective porin